MCHTEDVTVKERNAKIDILRIVFALIIVLHHISAHLDLDSQIGMFGHTAVEFFFFVSGYMLISQYDEKVNPLPHILKKLLPVVIATQVVFVVFELFFFDHGVIEGTNIVFYSVLDSLGLSMTGLPSWRLNDTVWFISAYIISIMIAYAITGIIGKHNILKIAPVLGVLLYGFLYWRYAGTISVWWVDEYKYCILIRAIGGTLLGISIYSIVSKLQEIKLTTFGRTILSLTEIGTIAGSIVLMIIPVPRGILDFAPIILLFVGIIFVLSEKTYIPCTLPKHNNRIGKQLAYVSILLFLSHDYWAYNISEIITDATDIVLAISVIILTMITMTICHFLKNVVIYIGKKMVI